MVGHYAESGEDMIEHGPVLSRNTNTHLDLGPALKLQDDRSQLDCLGPGAQNKQNPRHVCSFLT
jgi:hypothetical protein